MRKSKIGDCADILLPLDSVLAIRSGRIVDERQTEIGEMEYLVDNLMKRGWFLESDLIIF